MNSLKKIILIVITILIILSLIGFCLEVYSSRICKLKCEEKGTNFYELIHSGKFDTKDLCVCYLSENKIETFILK